MKNILLFPVGFFFLTAPGYSQAPKYSNEFLAIGVGGRALGMSNASVASTGDVSSGYWNPAGLLSVKGDLQITAMHSNYMNGLSSFDYAAGASHMDSTGVLAFSFVRFAVDNIPDTSELLEPDGSFNYDRIKSFSAADYAFLFSYAKHAKIPGLNYGVNAKVIRRKVGDFAGAWGFGLDAGIQYQWKKWRFGAMGRDVTGTFNAWSFNLPESMKNTFAQTNNEIPENSLEITTPKLILGVASKYILKNHFSVYPEINLDMTFDGKRNVLIKSNVLSVDPHAGIELGYDELIFVRAGLGNIQQSAGFDGNKTTLVQPAFGVGLRLKNLMVDYALSNMGGQGGLPYSHIFSLKLDIYKNKKVK